MILIKFTINRRKFSIETKYIMYVFQEKKKEEIEKKTFNHFVQMR